MINWFNEEKKIPSLHFLVQDIVEEGKMKEEYKRLRDVVRMNEKISSKIEINKTKPFQNLSV